MRRIIAVSLAFLLPLAAHAQGNLREEYEAFKKQAITSYSSFREQCNNEFVEFLKLTWTEFHSGPAFEKPIEKEVPPVVIKEEEKQQPLEDNQLSFDEVIPVPEVEPQPQPLEPIVPVEPIVEPVEPIIEPEEPNVEPEEPVIEPVEPDVEPEEPVSEPVEPVVEPEGPVIEPEEPVIEPVEPAAEPINPVPVIQEPYFEFHLYGTPLKVRADERNKFNLKSLKRNDISKAWKQLSGKDYDILLYDFLRLRDEYRLGDWAYLQAIYSFSRAFLESENEAILLTAYLFSQSGYKMRLGTTDSELCILYGTKHQIFGIPCYSIGSDFFYPLNADIQDLRIADFTFPNEKGLSLTLNDEPALSNNPSPERRLVDRKNHIWTNCSVNKNLIEFFNSYPTSQLDDNPITRWAIYANVPLDSRIKEQLYPSLKSAIAGKTKPEAVGILLNFVQTAFEYEFDNNVWGCDRAFFSEESLYYPFCDCEDRSILLSRLVRDLVGLDVVLVYYPGHLATAVRFDEELQGDYLLLDQDKYLVCDPTFIGAPIGMSMPNLDKKAAKVILLKR